MGLHPSFWGTGPTFCAEKYALRLYVRNDILAKTTKNNVRKCPGSGKILRHEKKYRWVIWVFPVTGLLALIWFLIRVVPKPSRAVYPCQRVAMPFASSFVVWLLGLTASSIFLRRARKLLLKSRYVLAGTCFACAVLAILWSLGINGDSANAGTFTPTEPVNSPMGIARGVHPGRVVWIHDANAANYNGTGYWSDDTNTDQTVVNQMMSNAIRWLAQETDDANSWDAIFTYFNEKRDKGSVGYQSGEKIAIKINLIQCFGHDHNTNPGNVCYNSPQLIYALLKQLVENAGIDANNITVFEAQCNIPNTIYDKCSVGNLAGVRFVDNDGGDGRIKVQRDPNAAVYHADSHVPTRWLPYCVSQAEYIINLGHLKGHVLAGFTVCAKNHFGSTWVEEDRGGDHHFWPGTNIHHRINAYDTTAGFGTYGGPARPMGSYNPLVELMGHEHLGNKTLLFMLDGLYATKTQQETITDAQKWLSAPFDNDWTSSIFISQDGVAIDSVALDFLRCEPTITALADGSDYSTAEDYLHEAALADDPCSGTFYDPLDDGNGLESLGVHEHWNNATDREYTRNLGTAGGIELISSEPPVQLQGDCDRDGNIDNLDMAVLSEYWMQDVQPCWNGDLDNNAYVDLYDFAIFAQSWNE